MALWDMTVGGATLASPDGSWGIDSFDGAHVIPVRKNIVSDSVLSAGTTVFLGAYEAFTFSLGGWAYAHTQEAAELAVANLIGRFGGRVPPVLSWIGAGGVARYGQVQVLASTVTREDSRTYRFKIAMKNLWGVWYGVVSKRDGNAINAPAVDLAPTGTLPWPSFDVRVNIRGPVTNPVLETDEGQIRYNGTVPAGKYIALIASPPQGFYGDGTGVLPSCTYTPKWGYLYSVLDKVRVTGAGFTSASSWDVWWRPVLL